MHVFSLRTKIRIISFIVFLSAVASCLLFLREKETAQLRSVISDTRYRCVSDLSTYIEDIEAILIKTIYSSSKDTVSSAANRLSSLSAAAKISLSQFPGDNSSLEKTFLYLSQVGDYANALSKKESESFSLSDEEAASLYSMLDYSKGINEELKLLLSKIEADFDTENTGKILNESYESYEKYSSLMLESAGTIEEGFSSYPTLLYDGPFSDHIMNKSPLMTEGKPEISKAEAKTIAAEFLGVSENTVEDSEEVFGNMPSYIFVCNGTTVSVSRYGGYVIYMMKAAFPGEATLSHEEALSAAKSFLSTRGYTDLNETYYESTGGVLYVNFAYEKDGVLFYTDLLKVGVCEDTGEIVFFDQRGFLVNHKEREIPKNALSEDTAKKAVSRSLSVQSVKKAFVPSSDGKEHFCYEFYCKGKRDENILVYIDAQTGKEHSILLLLINENGTLSL